MKKTRFLNSRSSLAQLFDELNPPEVFVQHQGKSIVEEPVRADEGREVMLTEVDVMEDLNW
jgi:hypothetical protein